MILYNPWGLLALLSLPAIVWLHRYVMRGRHRTVSCLSLWLEPEMPQAEGHAKRKPPMTLALLLELLAAALLSLALAGVEFSDSLENYPHIGVLIDTSASMAGGKSGDTAFDETISSIRRFSGKEKRLRLSIVLSGANPGLLGGRALLPAEAYARLAAYHPSGTHHKMNSALELLSVLAAEPEHTLIFSDDPHFRHPRMVRVGKQVYNAGFVAAGWEAGSNPFLAVRAFDKPAGAITVKIIMDAANHSSIVLDLKTAGEKFLSLPVPPGTRQADVYLPDDGLAIDNHITLIRPPVRRLSLRSAHPQADVQAALKRLARALPKLTATEQTDAEIIVSDGSFSIRNRFSIVFPSKQKGDAPRLFRDFSMDAFSPLLEGFDPRGLVWYGQKQVSRLSPAKTENKETAQILLQSGETPLLWQTNEKLFFNLDLERSNFFQHSAFPVLFHNLTEELDRAKGGLLRHNYKQGESLRFIRPPHWSGELRITFPNKESRRFKGRDILVGALDEAGVYILRTDNHTERFSVNFLDAREGALQLRSPPGEQPALNAGSIAGSDESRFLSKIIMLLAGLMLLGAWKLII